MAKSKKTDDNTTRQSEFNIESLFLTEQEAKKLKKKQEKTKTSTAKKFTTKKTKTSTSKRQKQAEKRKKEKQRELKKQQALQKKLESAKKTEAWYNKRRKGFEKNIGLNNSLLRELDDKIQDLKSDIETNISIDINEDRLQIQKLQRQYIRETQAIKKVVSKDNKSRQTLESRIATHLTDQEYLDFIDIVNNQVWEKLEELGLTDSDQISETLQMYQEFDKDDIIDILEDYFDKVTLENQLGIDNTTLAEYMAMQIDRQEMFE